MYQRFFQLYLEGKSIESSTRTRSLSSFHIPCLRCGPGMVRCCGFVGPEKTGAGGGRKPFLLHQAPLWYLWKGIQVILIRSLTQLSCQTRSRCRTRSVEVHLCHRRKLRQVLFPNSTDSPDNQATTALILLNENFKQFDGILIYIYNHHVYKHIYIYIISIYIYIYICVCVYLMFDVHKDYLCWLNHP